MKRIFCKKTAAAAGAAALSLLFCMPVMAAPNGHLDWADRMTIVGWVWDKDAPDAALETKIDITPEGSDKPVKTLTVTAESYRGDLELSIGSANHGFFCPVDWNSLSGDRFTVTAYTLSGGERTDLLGTITYDRSSSEPAIAATSVSDAKQASEESAPAGPGSAGPGAAPASASSGSLNAKDASKAADDAGSESVSGSVSGSGSASSSSSASGPGSASSSGPAAGPGSQTVADSAGGWKKGVSLGYFTTTGYCNCELCSGGWGLTYSGTVPKANHTISADINVLPIGTKVMINGIVYTVEDIGSGVSGKHIDIYYDNHADAEAHGTRSVEVFTVIPE